MKLFQPVIVFFLSSALLIAGCSPKVENRGYVSDSDIKEQVKAGRDSRDEVLTVLGSPSARSSFGPETWYYISTRKETIAFLAPEVAQQDVVRIVFDESGMVSQLENYTLENGQDVRISKRETPTEGHELGFMEQLLGNIGRFNQSKEGGVAGSNRRGPGGP